MDHASVEKNLVIDPPLPGKFSWTGRRLAYTLTSPIPYGEKYHLQIEGAREQFRSGNRLGQTLAIFEREFKRSTSRLRSRLTLTNLITVYSGSRICAAHLNLC